MDINALLKQVQDKGPNQSEAKKVGDYELPAEGMARARLVGYFEVGKHQTTYKGQPKVTDDVQLVFELSGGKHKPRDTDSGPVPIRMTLNMTLSTSELSWFYKTFSAMRTDETHMVALLGKPFLLDVEHRKVGEGDNAKTYANIKRGSVRKPLLDQMDAEGNITKVPVPVDPPITELKAFVWDFATAEMWDSIFIDGQWDERKDEKTGAVIAPAKSKNVLQLKIASAVNFKALPIYDYAAGKVKKEDVDALAAVVGDVDNAAADEDRDEADPTAGMV